MEVKSIYLDLQKAELNKKGKKSVWKLESEAFKEPLELTIGYDDEDLKLAYREIANLKETVESCDRRVTHLWYDWTRVEEIREEFTNKINNKQDQITELRELIKKQNWEISQLYKVIADLKTTIETQSGTILSMSDSIRNIQKKITKQPMVFQDKTFISGHESVGLSMIEVPSGEYLVISKYMLCDKNEFVENEDDIVFSKITVNDNCYIPMYQLYGGTDLDKPCATVYRDLVLIPC